MKTIQTVEPLITKLEQNVLIQNTKVFATLKKNYESTTQTLKEVSNEARRLRIAVVGQMKAGKSSFLNAAFFNTDVLPKADTPMTAALTRITYADQPFAEVTFYQKEDWASIEENANKYDLAFEAQKTALLETQNGSFFGGAARPTLTPSQFDIEAKIPFEYRAAKELVLQVKEHGLDVTQYLGQSIRLPTVASNAELAKSLANYVGSAGQFTAITKMTSLYVQDPRLQDIELIDTPGFNDPVVSRGRQTTDFLKQCDVIFLLSTTSQFLPQADLTLVREQINYAGIASQAVIVVGTQADMALRQARDILEGARQAAQRVEPEKRGKATLAYMIQLLDKKMKQEYVQKLESYTQNEPDGQTKNLLEILQKNVPHFISAGAWLIAERFTQNNPNDQAIIRPLETLSGFQFDEESLRAFSKIRPVREQLLTYKEQKEALLAQKEEKLFADYQRSFKRDLDEVKQELERDLDSVMNHSLNSLARSQQEIKRCLDKGKQKLENLFADEIFNIEKKFSVLINQSRQDVSQARTFRQHEESYQRSYSVSTSKWYNPFSWGSSETRYETVRTSYANVQDSIEAIESFKNQAIDKLTEVITNCIDIESFQARLAQGAFQLFDTSHADFDGEQILFQVKQSVRKITLPKVNFGRNNYSQKILSQFSGSRASGSSAVSQLQSLQVNIANQILDDLTNEIEEKTKNFVKILESERTTFVGTLTKDILSKLEDLKNKVTDKEQSIKNLKASIELIAQSSPLL